LELDIVVGVMFCLTVLHGVIHKQLALAMAAFLAGFLVETSSVRAGGTHCHSTGLLMFSHCSSVNSVVFLVPWVYSCLTSAKRLCGSSALMPVVCAGLFFGFCGVYELQGPSFGWWTWPGRDGIHRRTVPTDIQLWQPHSPVSAGVLQAVPHTVQALQDRVFGVPMSAPFYHMAMGWGFAICSQFISNRFMILALVSPALGMFWDPPARLLSLASGCKFGEACPVLMVVYVVVMLAIGSKQTIAVHTPPRDILLFLIPLINQLYFCSVGKRYPGVITPVLQALVWGIGFCSVIVHARACGLLGSSGVSPAASQKKNK